MPECTTIMITSFKGGVGKTTITANLAMALAYSGKRVLAIDCDFNMRCLDLVMGLESSVVYDICDVCRGSVPLSRAVIKDSRSDNLFFCPAPYTSNITQAIKEFENLPSVLATAKEEYNLDYILLDTPGDLTQIMSIVSKCIDRALIVATHAPSSIRAAEKTSSTLYSLGVKDRKLIINNFDMDAVKRGRLPGIIGIIDRTFVQLIGVVPYSSRIGEMQETGSLISETKKNNIYHAFNNITVRLSGKSIPLFTNFSRGYEKVKLK